MKKINLAISGCMGRMGKQLIKSSIKDKSIKLVTLTENRSINKKICGIKPELNTENAFIALNAMIIMKLAHRISHVNTADQYALTPTPMILN